MAGAMELFSVAGKLFLDKSQFDSDIKDADNSGKNLADNLSGYMEKAKKVLAGVFTFAAIQKTATAVWNLAKETAAAGDKIDKQSQALGMSRKAYQEWDYILSQSGASIDSMGLSMKTMTAAIMENSGETAAGLSKLGLSAAYLQSLSPEDQFEQLVRAFQQMPEGVEKSQLAIKLFGRNAQSLMPLLNSSAGTIDELRQAAEDLGLVMSDEDVDASVAFGDALDNLSRTWTSFKYKIGAQVLPGFTNVMKGIATSLGNVSTALVGAFKSGDWGAFFTTLITEIEGFIPGMVDTVIGVVNGIFSNASKLVGLAVSIINGLTQGIVDALPILIAELPTIFNTILEGATKSVTVLANGIIELINGIFSTNIPSFEVMVTWVQNAFEDVSNALDTVNKWVGHVWGVTVKWVQNAWNDIQSALNTVSEWIGKTWNTTVNWLQTNWDIVSSAFVDVGRWVGHVWGVTVKWVQTAWENVQGAFNTAAEWISNTTKDIKLSWQSTIDSWIEKISGWLDETGLRDIFINIGSTISDWIKKVNSWLDGTGLTTFTLNIGATVSDWIKRIWDWIENGVSIVIDFFNGNRDEPGTYEGDYEYDGRGGSFASGLNYVPYDGFRAVLHRGEAILNQSQSRDWRNNDNGLDSQRLYSAVAAAVAAAVSGIRIDMDGKAVGNAVTDQVSRNIYNAQLGRRFAML